MAVSMTAIQSERPLLRRRHQYLRLRHQFLRLRHQSLDRHACESHLDHQSLLFCRNNLLLAGLLVVSILANSLWASPSALAQSSPQPATGNARPALEDLLGLDPANFGPRAPRQDADPSSSEPAPASRPRPSERMPANFDGFFSNEMKALLEGSSQSRLDTVPGANLPGFPGHFSNSPRQTNSTTEYPRSSNQLPNGTSSNTRGSNTRGSNTTGSNSTGSNPLRSAQSAPSYNRSVVPPASEVRSALGTVAATPGAGRSTRVTPPVSRQAALPRPLPASTQPLATPRTLANADDARPLLSSNQRSQSLLEDSGTIELLSNEFADTLDLPPPYLTSPEVDAGTDPANRPPRSLKATQPNSLPLNRPLSEAVTSPNLPIQMGFQLEDIDGEDAENAPIKNRLDPADFEALVQSRSSSNTRNTPSDSRPVPAGFAESPDTKLEEPGVPVPERLHSRTVTSPTASSPTVSSPTASSRAPVASVPPAVAVALDTRRPVVAGLFEFERLRQQFSESFTNAATDRPRSEFEAATTYWIWRADWEQARQQVVAWKAQGLDDSEQWEVAWATAEIAIGSNDRAMLDQAEQQMLQWSGGLAKSDAGAGLESIYLDYVAAHQSILAAEPDYVAAVGHLRRVMERIATQVPEGTPWAQQRLSWILLHTQLQMARCIALGPYRAAPTSADQWFQQANATAEQLIQAQIAAPLIRTRVVRQQIECYAESGRFREIPPLANYLATWEHQLQAQGATDESLWVRQQATGTLLRCGLLAYNHQQLSVAQNCVQQAIAKLEREAILQRDSEKSPELAAAYWLQGAIRMQTGQGTAAIRSFDLALKHWPLDLEQRPAANGLEWGERLAIMAVAYWDQDQLPRAVQLNQDAVMLIQNAIDAEAAHPDRIETPLANLAVMTQSSDAGDSIVGAQSSETLVSNAVVAFETESTVEPTIGANATLAGAHMDAIREQLESPVVSTGSAAPADPQPPVTTTRSTTTRSSSGPPKRLPSRAKLR